MTRYEVITNLNGCSDHCGDRSIGDVNRLEAEKERCVGTCGDQKTQELTFNITILWHVMRQL